MNNIIVKFKHYGTAIPIDSSTVVGTQGLSVYRITPAELLLETECSLLDNGRFNVVLLTEEFNLVSLYRVYVNKEDSKIVKDLMGNPLEEQFMEFGGV